MTITITDIVRKSKSFSAVPSNRPRTAPRRPSSRRKPPGYEPRAFPPVAVTVDLVVFTVRDDELRILLVRRGEEPFRGAWALPGGFVRPDEDLAAAARRELAEETGISGDRVFLEQLAAYGAPGRDPRMRVVTVAFWAVAGTLPTPRGGSDAAEASLVPVKDIEEGGVRLAFDHYRIVREAVTHIRERLEEPTLAARFCPPEFTIRQLRRVYEAVWRTPIDPANFQRRVRTSHLFRRSAVTAPSGERGGRPASVWTAEETGGWPGEAESGPPPPPRSRRPPPEPAPGTPADRPRASAPPPARRVGKADAEAPSGRPVAAVGPAPARAEVLPASASAPPPVPEPDSPPPEPRRVRFTPPRRRTKTSASPKEGAE